MKQGFALLELLFGLMIASLLTGLLFSVLYQTNNAYKSVTRIIDGHTRAMMVQHVMTRDLAGACIPLQVLHEKDTKEQQSASKKTVEQQESAETKKASDGQQETKKSPPPLTKVFYADNKDGMLNQLTFITMNALPAYWQGQDVDRIKPRIARVTYRLQKDEQASPEQASYTLMREESERLVINAQEQDKKDNARSYPVITHIKNMSIKYSVRLSDKQQTNDNTKDASPVPESVKTMTEWNVESEQGNQELIKQKIMLPNLVEITLVLWSTVRGQDESYTFSSALAAEHIRKPLPAVSTSSVAADKKQQPEMQQSAEQSSPAQPKTEAETQKSSGSSAIDQAHELLKTQTQRRQSSLRTGKHVAHTLPGEAS